MKTCILDTIRIEHVIKAKCNLMHSKSNPWEMWTVDNHPRSLEEKRYLS